MTHEKWLAGTLAALGAIVATVPELTWMLVLLMVIDTIMGVLVAWKQRDVSATAMWGGATKKLGSLLIIAVFAVLAPHVNLFNVDLVQVATLFYIGPELLSIIRNAAILGIPVPPQMTDVLRYFQEDKQK